MGLLGMTLSPESGGGNQAGINAILAIEELAKFSPVTATPVFESNIGPVKVVDSFGTLQQKNRIIPGVCKGTMSVSVGMTEPEAGSDPTSLSTRVEEDGDGYLLKGRNIFISGGGEATHCLVYCRFGSVPGSQGNSKEFPPPERMHRDALAWRVAGGTVQMLRITMASMRFSRRFNQRPQS